MMDWRKYYEERTVSAEEAVRHIKSGDRVLLGHAIGTPEYLIQAMVANASSLKDVETVHMVGMGASPYCKEELRDSFRHNSLFVGGRERKAIAEGRGDYTPIYFSQIPSLFWTGALPVDVFMLQVSPPDKFGYVSLGVSVDYAVAAINRAKCVIVEVNKYMPRTHGDSFIHVSQIQWFVEHDAPLIEVPMMQTTEVERAIGKNCASLVEDGATLQLGIGSLPDAVLEFLGEKNDLGIHSEMIADGAALLMQKGVINNSRKTLHHGKTAVSFLMGTPILYEYADDNPAFYMAPVDYINDPYVIAKNYKMVSINSCVQVDMMGQVCSEAIGLTQISAVGGQVDFVRGANLCPGGKAIIAMPSTARGGTVSKIVPFLDQGACVTTSRCDVHYIVTEYGIADMQGVTLRERSRRLIAIAHPDFRPMLIEEYERRYHMAYRPIEG